MNLSKIAWSKMEYHFKRGIVGFWSWYNRNDVVARTPIEPAI
jgi:hypothetical protein